jgi:hypothetical protein
MEQNVDSVSEVFKSHHYCTSGGRPSIFWPIVQAKDGRPQVFLANFEVTANCYSLIYSNPKSNKLRGIVKPATRAATRPANLSPSSWLRRDVWQSAAQDWTLPGEKGGASASPFRKDALFVVSKFQVMSQQSKSELLFSKGLVKGKKKKQVPDLN